MTIQRPIKPRRSARRAAGFSLVEILLALGIFMIGMIAVVSLLPVAAMLQRETATDVIASEVSASAQAVVKTGRLTYGPPGSGNLGAYHPDTFSTNTFLSPLVINRYPVADRAYPSSQLDGLNTQNCEWFWVPLIQDLNGDPANPNWSVRILILQTDSQANYTVAAATALGTVINSTDTANWIPKVVQTTCTLVDEDTFNLGTANHGLEGGDFILDNNGNYYIVAEANGTNVTVTYKIIQTPNPPTSMYFAPALGGSGSPLKRIVTVAPIVTAP